MDKSVSSTTKVCMIKTSFMQFRNYIYIGADLETRKAFIVDPAWEIGKIEQVLKQEKLELDKILLTHSHLDHTNLVNKLVDKYDALVFMSEEEMQYYHYKCSNLIEVHDMETIPIGLSEVKCILTPGHTKGGACYQFGNSLFTGDSIFIEGCGICRTPGGSAESMYTSVQKLKAMIADDVLVYPGHSYGVLPGQSFEYVRAHNIYFQIEELEAFVKFRNRSNTRGIFDFK